MPISSNCYNNSEMEHHFSGWLSYYEKKIIIIKHNIHTGEVKGIEVYKLAAAKFCLKWN